MDLSLNSRKEDYQKSILNQFFPEYTNFSDFIRNISLPKKIDKLKRDIIPIKLTFAILINPHTSLGLLYHGEPFLTKLINYLYKIKEISNNSSIIIYTYTDYVYKICELDSQVQTHEIIQKILNQITAADKDLKMALSSLVSKFITKSICSKNNFLKIILFDSTNEKGGGFYKLDDITGILSEFTECKYTEIAGISMHFIINNQFLLNNFILNSQNYNLFCDYHARENPNIFDEFEFIIRNIQESLKNYVEMSKNIEKTFENFLKNEEIQKFCEKFENFIKLIKKTHFSWNTIISKIEKKEYSLSQIQKIENTMFFYFLSEDYIANTLNKEFTPYILSGVTKESNNFLTKIENYRINNNNSQMKYYSLMASYINNQKEKTMRFTNNFSQITKLFEYIKLSINDDITKFQKITEEIEK